MGLCIVCVVNFLWIVWLTFLFLEAYQQTEFRLILLHTNSLERDTLLLFQFFKSANRCLKLWNVKLLGKLFGPICFEMAKMGTTDLNNFYIANCVAFCDFLFFFFLYGLMKYIYDFFFILQFFCGFGYQGSVSKIYEVSGSVFAVQARGRFMFVFCHLFHKMPPTLHIFKNAYCVWELWKWSCFE